MKNTFTTLALIPAALAFAPQEVSVSKTALKAATIGTDKPLYDPLGLYPVNSLERMTGAIKPLETFPEPPKAVTDPLGLYQDQSEVVTSPEMSASLPFVARPAHLDGTLAGDRGFDPFNFSAEEGSLEWYRKSEQKHGRIAMLAAVGWPIAELFHKSIADSIGFPSLLASGDRVPSVLNDGLAHAPFEQFWIPVIAAASAFELSESFGQEESKVESTDMDQKSGFSFVEEAEVFNGRLGMMAITGFAIQEFLFQDAVVNQFPIFFKPINVAMEQLMNSA
eukprot:CAMPEP_0113623248 /NCGR_PEP_ID=MMETSP0017_2-20120614/11952_1 /TAXON_ID=2856 /ORGANISM="Cylindrotheca closterium" /LENGTH=278 /DNA_ID=CAMNT_0000533177 /DNA_START=146 /DNA_END=979 /DNA_ORIENTATION=- /assembly_acc=CAM_ASM_000147